MSIELDWVLALSLKIGKPTVDLMQLAIILIEASFGLPPNSLFNIPPESTLESTYMRTQRGIGSTPILAPSRIIAPLT